VKEKNILAIAEDGSLGREKEKEKNVRIKVEVHVHVYVITICLSSFFLPVKSELKANWKQSTQAKQQQA